MKRKFSKDFQDLYNKITSQRISWNFIFSYIFFLAAMSLDFYITNVNVQGDWGMEANYIARIWSEAMGALRFIEIPIWVFAIFSAAFIVNAYGSFFALLLLNTSAFNHLIGFMTWMPFGTFDFLYRFPDWAMGFAISILSLFFSLILSSAQLFLSKKVNN
ncbi:hypothetical protein HYW53_00205 [Candidatus Giovannonibacteria bacterium]|nr:hypothetical protein [Candidatus Giovannonibacteria bacterium]